MITVRAAGYRRIPGWFAREDHAMFGAILDAQERMSGALVEIGAYLGRSAVVIGEYRRPDERFVVIDLFDSQGALPPDADGEANRLENANSYPTLTRAAFEANYLSLHSELPEIVQDASSCLPDHLSPGSARFVHVDGSHLYPQVRQDIAHAAAALRRDGAIALDDYRSPHTPGVAAAAWEAVLEHGMAPFALTPAKMYATWGDPAPYQIAVATLLRSDPNLISERQVVCGHPVTRLQPRGTLVTDLKAVAYLALERNRASLRALSSRLTRPSSARGTRLPVQRSGRGPAQRGGE